MPNQPRDDNPARSVRIGGKSRRFRAGSDELWDAAKAKAAGRGETVSDVIRRALERYVK